MLKCPKCNSEYREEYTICSDCKCELIEVPEEKEEIIPSGIKMNKFSKSVLIVISLFFGGSFIYYFIYSIIY